MAPGITGGPWCCRVWICAPYYFQKFPAKTQIFLQKKQRKNLKFSAFFFKQNVSRHISCFILKFSSEYTGTGTGLIYGGCSRNFCMSSLTGNLMTGKLVAIVAVTWGFIRFAVKLDIQKFLEQPPYINPVSVPFYSLENVEIKDETCRETFFENTQNMKWNLENNEKNYNSNSQLISSLPAIPG